MRRGEIWWVDFDERRPVVLLSDEESSAFQAMQVVEPAGVDMSGLGVEVAVGAPEGLPFDGVRFPARDSTVISPVPSSTLYILKGTSGTPHELVTVPFTVTVWSE